MSKFFQQWKMRRSRSHETMSASANRSTTTIDIDKIHKDLQNLNLTRKKKNRFKLDLRVSYEMYCNSREKDVTAFDYTPSISTPDNYHSYLHLVHSDSTDNFSDDEESEVNTDRLTRDRTFDSLDSTSPMSTGNFHGYFSEVLGPVCDLV
jgi:hypothetical protein